MPRHEGNWHCPNDGQLAAAKPGSPPPLIPPVGMVEARCPACGAVLPPRGLQSTVQGQLRSLARAGAWEGRSAGPLTRDSARALDWVGQPVPAGDWNKLGLPATCRPAPLKAGGGDACQGGCVAWNPSTGSFPAATCTFPAGPPGPSWHGAPAPQSTWHLLPACNNAPSSFPTTRTTGRQLNRTFTIHRRTGGF